MKILIDFIQTLLAIAVGTIVPVYLSLYLTSMVKPGRGPRFRYVAALGLGILLYFFIDVTIDSTELGVNSGFSGGAPQLGLILSFALGVLILSALEYQLLSPSKNGNYSNAPSIFPEGILFVIPALIALGIGIHGAGEGSSFSYVASTTSSASLVDAFGGYGAVISYVIHKFLEAIVVGCAYFIYVLCDSRSASPTGGLQRRRWEIPLLGALLWIPSLIGTVVGYSFAVDPIYFYAFASGASVYSLLRLAIPAAQPSFELENYNYSRSMFSLSIVILAGFLVLYFAALFHSTTIF